MQTPPVFSAIRVNGKRAYAESERGDLEMERLAPYRCIASTGVGGSWPVVELEIHCEKGFMFGHSLVKSAIRRAPAGIV